MPDTESPAMDRIASAFERIAIALERHVDEQAVHFRALSEALLQRRNEEPERRTDPAWFSGDNDAT